MNVSNAERLTLGVWEAVMGKEELEGKLLGFLSNVMVEPVSGDTMLSGSHFTTCGCTIRSLE